MRARSMNSALDSVRDHPGRFGMFAAIPLPDTEGSLAEIAYALDVLKLDGIGLMTSFGGKLLGDPAFAAVFDELNRRKAVVFVHPTCNAFCGNPSPLLQPPTIEFPVDTTRTIASLLLSGTIARCRDIRFLFSHGGGVLAMLVGRLAGTVGRLPAEQQARLFPNGLTHELAQLFYDVVSVTHPVPMAAIRRLIPITQLTLGSDYPFGSSAPQIGGLHALDLAPAELRAIERDNALRLVPRLAG